MNLSQLNIPAGCKVTLVGDNAVNIENVEHFHQGHHFFDTAAHPMAAYIMQPKKAEEVIEEMRHLVSAQSQNSPKDLLAPLKAAMECKPRAVMQNVPLDAFNREFMTSVSEESFKNWIRGNRNTLYEDAYLDDYIEVFSMIMKE